MKRIKNLVDKVGLSSSTLAESGSLSSVKSPSLVPPSTKVKPVEPAHLILDGYFDAAADTGVCDLNSLPVDASQELIQSIDERLQARLGNISKKLSSAILESQQSYDKELQRVRDLQKTLKIAFMVCRTSKDLMVSSRSLQCLNLLVRIHRRRNLSCLQVALNTIKTLEHTDVHLRQLMEEERYPDAIQLCLECRKVSTAYGHYSCIKDLCAKLQDTMEQIEEQMDEALSKICDNFDGNPYTKLQVSYKLLGKRQTAIDQLLMHFTTCIHKSALKLLLEHVMMHSKEYSGNLQKKSFNDLCQSIDPSAYIPCLTSLCKTLVNIMWCYQQVFHWHRKELANASSSQSAEMDIARKYVLQKLDKGRQRIWLDVQSRIKHMLISVDISHFEYEHFIKVVSVMNTFLSVGEKFCGRSNFASTTSQKCASNLQEPIYQLSLKYFHTYHRNCLDELHMFLTNEAWESCPVHSDFSVLQLPEFKPFHAAARRGIVKSSLNVGDEHEEACSGLEENPNKLFDRASAPDKGHPDESIVPFLDDKDITSNDHHGDLHGPILTNSALNILRICGKYLSMCEVLEPISTDVVICMSHLFDYYLISVYHLFVTQGSGGVEHSDKLSTTLDRIKRELINTPSSDASNVPRERVILPTLSPAVILHSRERLFGFRNRITAAESLVNLAEQLKLLRPSLEKVLHSSKRAFLHQFFAQTVDTCSEVRSLVYYAVAIGIVDYDLILRQVPQVNWEIREIMSQHNTYIDEILTQLKILQCTLSPMLSTVPSSAQIMRIIWEYCAVQCNQSFVEGYSCVKKCGNEGRALMQLDYQQFISKFEDLTKLAPAPGKGYVEGYLKAFYLSEEDFEVWREKHPEYTDKQLSSLLACITAAAANYGKKNKRQKMRAVFEDITRKK